MHEDRVFGILRENNPELTGEKRRTIMKPPQVWTASSHTAHHVVQGAQAGAGDSPSLHFLQGLLTSLAWQQADSNFCLSMSLLDMSPDKDKPAGLCRKSGEALQAQLGFELLLFQDCPDGSAHHQTLTAHGQPAYTSQVQTPRHSRD